MKVRVKAIASNISKSPMPSSVLTDFLTVLIIDGNYFPDDFLWDCELRNLEFDGLGGTRNMLPTKAARGMQEVLTGEDWYPTIQFTKVNNTIGLEVIVKIKRAMMILQNIIFLR